MAVYGLDFYGLSKYGSSELVDYHVQPFVANSLDYGLIRVSWRPATGTWTEFRLIRNRYGYPVHENDGEILITQVDNASTLFMDTDPIEGRYVYYGIFLLTNAETNTWIRAGACAGLANQNHQSTDWLMQLIPNYYKYDTDGELTTDQFANPYIEQFISVFGWGLDELKTQYDMAKNINDPRRINMRSLEALAKTLGIQWDPEVSGYTMRQRVVAGAHVAREKGTLGGWRNLFNIMTGWDADITVGKNLLLNDDQSSFVHPIFPDWSPFTNYAEGETVKYISYWYVAKAGGAYGEDQKPADDGTDNTWWTTVKDRDDTTLMNPETGGQEGWESVPLTPAYETSDLYLRLSTGIQNPFDPGVYAYNMLNIQNTSTNPADFLVRSVPSLRRRVGKTTQTMDSAVVNDTDTVTVLLDENVTLPATPFPVWVGWDEDYTTAEETNCTGVTGTGRNRTLTVKRAKNYHATVGRAHVKGESIHVQDTQYDIYNVDPMQAIKYGVPVPWLREGNQWDDDKEYHTGDLIEYGARPYVARRASTNAAPPYDPDWEAATPEWVAVGSDKRIALMLSGYAHQPYGIYTVGPARVNPHVEWYDIDGNLIQAHYAKSRFQGLKNVLCATTGPLPDGAVFTAGTPDSYESASPAVLSIDGVTPHTFGNALLSDRVLVKDQANPERNGVYYCNNTGIVGSAKWQLKRAQDNDTNAEIQQWQTVYVEEGTVNAGKQFYLSTSASTNRVYLENPEPWLPPDVYFDSFTSDWGENNLAGRAIDQGNDLGFGTHTWAVGVGQWTVDGFEDGTAYPTVPDVRSLAVVTGQSNCKVSVTFKTSPVSGSTQGMVLRYLNDSNYWRADRTTLRKKVAGAWTTVGTYTTPFADKDRITVKMEGNVYTVYRNNDLDNPVLTYTDATSFNSTQNNHGMVVE